MIARETTTNREGDFNLVQVLPGLYTIRIEATGFKTFETKNITLDQTQVLNLGSLSLEVGQVSESVSVESKISTVETVTG